VSAAVAPGLSVTALAAVALLDTSSGLAKPQECPPQWQQQGHAMATLWKQQHDVFVLKNIINKSISKIIK
jgi:hypothetical protein